MVCEFNLLIGKKILKLELDSTEIKRILVSNNIITTDENIAMVAITKDMILIRTKLPKSAIGKPFLTGEPIKQNTIDAYDFEGNHLWNISEIVGELHCYFQGACLHTKETGEKIRLVDKNKLIDGHEYLACFDDCKLYLIDLTDKRFLQEVFAP